MNTIRANPMLAFAAGGLPIVTVHACLGISLLQENVPACIPYIDGCTSVSATGRYGAAWYVFKAGMLPAAALMAAFFIVCARWLGQQGFEKSRTLAWLPRVGAGAAAALALYTIFLGVDGELLRLLRRSGAILYFGLSALAQLLLLNVLWDSDITRHRLPDWLRPALLTLGAFLLVIGLGSIPVKQFLAEPDALENAIEWQFAIAMMMFYVLIGAAWRTAGSIPGASDAPGGSITQPRES